MTSHRGAGLATPPPDKRSAGFDIVSHYNRLINSDPSITPAVAAIESLIAQLSATSVSTTSETINLLDSASKTLLGSQSNPIPLSAGTELLKRYITNVLQQQPAQLSGNDFTQLRRQLITNSKLFVSRTKAARSKIAKYALPFIRDESTIFAFGSSRVVDAVLTYAAEHKRYFHVILIQYPPVSEADSNAELTPLEQCSQRLLSLGIPVATIPLPSLTHVISSLPNSLSSNVLFLLGAEAVLENGAAISNLGSHLVASTAKQSAIPCYFAAESYKFTRQFPTGCGDTDLQSMGAKQEVLKFKTSLDGENNQFDMLSASGGTKSGMVDITPPELISGLITENGMTTCEGVAEELIKLWF